MQILYKCDSFAKPLQHFRVQTLSGATITIISFTLIILLAFSELYSFREPFTRQEIMIDSIKNDRMRINLNITIPKIPCDMLSLDTMDIVGHVEPDVAHSINKISLDEQGRIASEPIKHVVNAASFVNNATDCGSCYGADSKSRKCCQTCQDVMDAYREKGWASLDLASFAQCVKEGKIGQSTGGCRFEGFLEVNKVAGSFHITPGHTMRMFNQYVHDLTGINLYNLEFDHHIDNLTFGSHYPGLESPLNNHEAKYEFTSPTQYYSLNLVPTIYSDYSDNKFNSYQYSVTSLNKASAYSRNIRTKELIHDNGETFINFLYEISPVLVKITSESKSIMHFLVNLCAIVGGIYTVASMIDSFLYRSSCFFAKRD